MIRTRSPNRHFIQTLVLTSACSMAFHPLTTQAADEPSGYPRINVSTGYEVDPSWPQRPDNTPWGDMPGVAVDAHDHVWLFTRSDTPVQVYDANGRFIRSWGQGLIGRSHHIRIDHQGNVWLADNGHHVVWKFDAHGHKLAMFGTKGEAGVDKTHFDQPTDMAIAPNGDIFVSDGYGNNRVVHLKADGTFVKAWGRVGTKPGEFSLPHSIAIDSRGRLYVADRNNSRIQVFDQSGRFLAEWRDLIVPWGLWVGKNDEIWACGSTAMQWQPGQSHLGVPPKDQVFMKFNADGKLLAQWTVPKGTDGQEKIGECNWVHAIAVDSKGNLYVGDIRGQRAQKFILRPGERH